MSEQTVEQPIATQGEGEESTLENTNIRPRSSRKRPEIL